jgi:hypothetical protein
MKTLALNAESTCSEMGYSVLNLDHLVPRATCAFKAPSNVPFIVRIILIGLDEKGVFSLVLVSSLSPIERNGTPPF